MRAVEESAEMLTYDAIRAMPTCIESERWKSGNLASCSGAHESILRAYHILERVKYLLDAKVPAEVVRELIQMMETGF